MAPRLRRSFAGLWLGLILPFSAAAQEPPPAPPAVTAIPVEPEPIGQWLAEVRAQRQAREDRRRAQKEAMDARRRWIDPWGAAQKEAREQEAQRRHDALIDHIERDRQTLRSQLPWRREPGPWQTETAAPALQSHTSPAKPGAEVSGPSGPRTTPYPLPGWDNRWYYRGF